MTKTNVNVFNPGDCADIFIQLNMKCTIHIGFASLNRTFHLSPHENIYAITIHYLYNIQVFISQEFLIESSAAEKPLMMLHLLHHLKFRHILCFTNTAEAAHRYDS